MTRAIRCSRSGRRPHSCSGTLRAVAAWASTKSRRASNQMTFFAKPGKLAFRPLGFGTTNTRAPAMRSGLGPAPSLRASRK